MEYQDAVCTLNTLPTNGSFRQQVGGERGAQQLQLQTMKDFLERAGLTVEELDHLNIIHVAGTKGKGSTCAFTEQILRSYGFRTGFYRKFPGFSMSSMEAKTGNSSILSSPHLVHVRERIRIQGQPISKDLFTKYFWQVYSRLDDTKDCHGGSMPPVFRFLTILAFHIFLQEKVDLAVIEVGIGGAYDCTNIIRRPWVCGISSLEIDHKNILGDTIEEIAWHKGGIFKPGVPAFTVKQQEGAMIVLQERAEEIGCSLSVCPELGDYTVDEGVLRLSLAGDHQRMNASLALQLSHSWLQRRCLPGPDKHLPAAVEFSGVTQAKSFKPSPVMLKGLSETEWPGRTQTLRHGPITYFLDGAHTMGSMRACAQWFIEASTQRELVVGGAAVRVLLFNVTGGRDAAAMLKLLEPHHFDFAVFCPIITETLAMCNADQQNFNVSVENMLCLNNQQSWRLLTEPREGQARPDVGEEANEAQLLISGNLPLVTEQQQRRRPGGDTLIFPCILSALQWITQARDPMLALPGKRVIPVKPSVAAKASPLRDATEIHVLITGSLHLVGGALTHLDPASAS